MCSPWVTHQWKLRAVLRFLFFSIISGFIIGASAARPQFKGYAVDGKWEKSR